MTKGDLVYFRWPTIDAKRIDDIEYFEEERLGLVIDVFRRPDDKIGDELYVLCDDTSWSVPEKWCRKV